VRNQFYQQVLYDALNSPAYFSELTTFCGTIQNTHPHQPPTPTDHAALKYTLLARGCGDGKVRNAFYQHVFVLQPSPAFVYSPALPLSHMQQQTHQTTQPHATIILLDQKLKDQRTKKVRNELLKVLSSFKILVNSPHFLHSSKQKQSKNTQTHNNPPSLVTKNN
jgi:hypothetical protein